MRTPLASLLLFALLSGCAVDPQYAVAYAPYYRPWVDEAPSLPAKVVHRQVEGMECARRVSVTNQGLACPTCASFPVTERGHGTCR